MSFLARIIIIGAMIVSDGLPLPEPQRMDLPCTNDLILTFFSDASAGTQFTCSFYAGEVLFCDRSSLTCYEQGLAQ